MVGRAERGEARYARSVVDPFLESDRALADRSPGEKVAEVLEAMEFGIELQRAALRARHPEASEAEVDALLLAWLKAEH